MNVHRFALIWTSVYLLGAVAIGFAQEPAAPPGESAQEGSAVSPSEVQRYLGYWLLSMKLGERDAKMGLVLRAEEDGLSGRLVSPFGEMEASSFHKQGEALAFDLRSGLGNFEVETRIEEGRMLGSFQDASGSLAADFTGSQSDRVAFQQFLIPDNETRITRGERMIRVRFATPSVEHPDYAQIESAQPGDVVAFLEDMAIKLMTDFDLRFGDVTIPKENVAVDYPGVYSLWIERTGSGWSLVFNEKADVWGTQHDAAADVARVALGLTQAAEPTEQLTAKLEERENEGTLRFTWGSHSWSAPFLIVAEPESSSEGIVTDGR